MCKFNRIRKNISEFFIKDGFYELSKYEKCKKIEYIKSNKLNIKFFKRKYYDVLEDKFYSVEYDSKNYDLYLIKKEFNNFHDFYIYVGNDIYENTCFYGYKFSKEEIIKYKLKIKKINFDSFIDGTIDEVTFESDENIDEKLLYINKMDTWLKKCKQINSYNEFEEKCEEFKRKFENDSFDLPYSKIFISTILKGDNRLFKRSIISNFKKRGEALCISFIDILMIFGVKSGEEIVKEYEGYNKYNNRLEFKKKIEIYKNLQNRKIRFDKTMCIYVVEDIFDEETNYSYKYYFLAFDELVNFLNNDLSNADLTFAPIDRRIISKHKINQNTKFPVENVPTKYEVKKYYLNGKFYVEQNWYNNDILLDNKLQEFGYFFDFVHFLKGDISNADLIMCEGVGNIKNLNLNLNNIKAKSNDLKDLNLKFNLIDRDEYTNIYTEYINKNELVKIREFQLERSEEYDDSKDTISYISDIHLKKRYESFNVKSKEDKLYVIRNVVSELTKGDSEIILIAGDLTYDINDFKLFLSELNKNFNEKHFFFVLGNHELWYFNNKNIDEIVGFYKNLLASINSKYFHLIYNNLFYLEKGWKEITEKELGKIDSPKLKEITRKSKVVLFGGTGFSGFNKEFNADNGIYNGTLSREQEIKETIRFFNIYKKVVDTLCNRNLIILTHMPINDWNKDSDCKEGVIYVYGHNHHNYFNDDGKKRIYADNQIGYKGKNIHLKKIYFDSNYDYFVDYKDGIYEISKNDYLSYYHGINVKIDFNYNFSNLYLLKKNNAYMFLMKSNNGNLNILNGGKLISAKKRSVEYFYEYLDIYTKSIKMYLSKYNDFQNKISLEIKKIGGDGTIHGCIIDIDFFNHLYINPLDSKVTPYFATSIIDKYVYDNIQSLLINRLSDLYSNYLKLLGSENINKNELIVLKDNYVINNKCEHVKDTTIYKYSRIIKSLQYTTKYNLIRVWDDSIIDKATSEIGCKIITNLLKEK